jgi:hypothetical protein
MMLRDRRLGDRTPVTGAGRLDREDTEHMPGDEPG